MSTSSRVAGTPVTDAGLSPLLTVDQVASWLSVSRQSVYKRAERGQLPGARYVGRRLYFHRLTLVHWLDQNRASSQIGGL